MKLEVYNSTVFNDSEEPVDGKKYIVTFTDEEIAELLSAYDKSSPTSPFVSVCRPIVRALLDSLGE